LGVITTIRCFTGNVFLQLADKRAGRASALPLLAAEPEISVKMLLTDGRGGVSLVLPLPILPVLLSRIPTECTVLTRYTALVEIIGYGLLADGCFRTELYRLLARGGIELLGFSASDTVLTLAVEEDSCSACMKILRENFAADIE